ncbi:hypothetical protein Q3G72_006005 [Acer saccharum]|nr:hypothetical protein Q3G72_006005 [Acer saccharum]
MVRFRDPRFWFGYRIGTEQQSCLGAHDPFHRWWRIYSSVGGEHDPCAKEQSSLTNVVYVPEEFTALLRAVEEFVRTSPRLGRVDVEKLTLEAMSSIRVERMAMESINWRKYPEFQVVTLSQPPQPDPFPESSCDADAGAVFILESKGEWWHARFHLTTAIVGPTILTLPYVFRGLGWGLGCMCLTVMGLVTFYSYYLMSRVLDHCEKAGRCHIRFPELAADVLESGWMFYFVIFIQTAINTGVGIGAILLAGECLQVALVVKASKYY